MDTAFEDLEQWQHAHADSLGLADPESRHALWFDYCLLQVYDLLSLYFCCDGYANDAEGTMRAVRLSGVPLSRRGEREAEIAIVPVGPNVVQLDPYPFDISPLPIAVVARMMTPEPGAAELQVREAYYRASRQALAWEITS